MKVFTFVGNKPDKKVAHVRLAGYLWSPEADTIQLDISPPHLGITKCGRSRDDYKEALRLSFTN